jgi:hypothetical protein
MKKVLLFLIISCTGSIVMAQNNKMPDPFLTKSLTGAMVKMVEAQTSGGNITVESVAAGQERAEVFIWASGTNNNPLSKEEIQKRLDEFYDFKLAVEGSTLTAIAKNKRQNMNWKKSLSISFKFFVDKNVATHLTTSGGNINLKEISGEQKITTSGGNLVIDHVKGKLRGTTSGGNINVGYSDDDIELTTSGGNVHASNCRGTVNLVTSGGNVIMDNMDGTVDAATSGGNVRAADTKGDLKASTSGGNVDVSGLSGNLVAGTSGGDIKVAIKDPGKFIKIKNSGGKIELELPAGKGYDVDLAADKIKTDNLVNFSGKAGDDEILGKINGGGTAVTVNAGNGKLILTFK